jgi:hypothetical protein
MGEAGHAKAQRYSWASVASQVVEVYEEAREAAHAASFEVMNVHHAV